jgi:Tol biopolymer transport system component
VISPDEKAVAFERTAVDPGAADVWVRDLIRETEPRFTNAPSNRAPIWSPKGDCIASSSNRNGGVSNLYQKDASRDGKDELLLQNRVNDTPQQWPGDGRFIVYAENDPKTKYDFWVLPTEGAAPDQKPRSQTHPISAGRVQRDAWPAIAG